DCWWRTGVRVRLAQRQIRPVVANHSNRFDRHVERQAPEEGRTSHESDDANAEDGNKQVEGCRRGEIIIRNLNALSEAKAPDDRRSPHDGEGRSARDAG